MPLLRQLPVTLPLRSLARGSVVFFETKRPPSLDPVLFRIREDALSCISIRGKAGLRVLRKLGTPRLAELVPKKDEAKTAFSSWLRECRLIERGNPQFDRELENDSWRRLRARITPQHIYSLFIYWDEATARVFTLYIYVLTQTDRDSVITLLNDSTLLKCSDMSKILAQFSELSALAKKFRDLWREDWKLFVDLQLLTDYRPAADIALFVDDVRDWIQTPCPHTIDGSEIKFLNVFRSGVEKFLLMSPASRNLSSFEPVTVDMFCKDPAYWAVPGSSNGPGLRLLKDGKIIKAKHTKWASAMNMSGADVYSCLFSWKKQLNGSIQKRERGKVRAVIAGDFELYMKMSFISKTINQLLKGYDKTALFMTSGQMLTLWETMATDTLEQKSVLMPLDQSKFDHMISKEMIDITNSVLKDWLISMKIPNIVEIIDVFDRIVYALDGGFVLVGDQRLEYKKGVLSGWGWTALYDTLINAGELLGFSSLIEEDTTVAPVRDFNCMGDDDRTKCESYGAAIALWTYYEEAGFIVNPKKFFIAMNADEYLREVAFNGRVAGYPARAVGSLVFRNPVNNDPPDGSDRLREQYASWLLLFGRLGYTNWQVAHIDISRANNYGTNLLDIVEETPASLGGVGLHPCPPEMGHGLKMVPGRVVVDWTFDKIPPLASVVVIDTPFTSKDAMDLWIGNVAPAASKKVKKDPDMLEEVEIPLRINRASMPPVVKGIPLQARARSGLSPTLVALYQSGDIDDTSWMEESSASVASWLRHRTSKRVYIDWVRGKLPFAMPSVAGVIPIAISALHKQFSSAWWTWCLSKSVVSYSLVLRAAVRAESDTRAACLSGLATHGLSING